MSKSTELVALLATLDNNRLETLPCANNAGDVNFQIGITDNCKIIFTKVNDNLYNLSIVNLDKTTIDFGIAIATVNFTECERIAQFINGLQRNEAYKVNRDNHVQDFINNRNNIVIPIFERLEK